MGFECFHGSKCSPHLFAPSASQMFSGQLSEAVLEMLEHLRAQHVKLFCLRPVVGDEHAGPSSLSFLSNKYFVQSVVHAATCSSMVFLGGTVVATP